MRGQGPRAIARYKNTNQGLAVFARDFGDKLEANPALSNPTNPTLVVYKADVASFDAALIKQDKNPAALADRDAKGLKVFQHVGHLVDFVQGVADKQPTHADARTLILAAGLSVWEPKKRQRDELAAKHTGMPTEAQLIARPVKGAVAFFWEHSLDQQTWTASSETASAKTTITGLPPGRVVYFRFRTLSRKGKSPYSVVVSLMAQ